MTKVFRVVRYLFIISLFIQLSCSSEDGINGEVGPQGENGLQGLTGEIGPAGKDGNVILAGNGEPTNELGEIGDFYLDKDTGELYGPKIDDTTWGLPVSLVGSVINGIDGQDGADGSQIFTGIVPPSDSFGQDGDYYLDAITSYLYGPKTNGIWLSPISLAGNNGIDGIDGQDGEDGEDGTDGVNGIDGEDGEDGEDGNANVIYSNWINADWDIQDTPTLKSMRIPITEIDDSTLRDKTAVLVYARQFGQGSVYSLPTNGRWVNAEYSFTFGDSATSLQGIIITIKSTDGVALIDLQYEAVRGNRFRYVLIPAGVGSRSANTPDLNDYEAVKKYYGIKD